MTTKDEIIEKAWKIIGLRKASNWDAVTDAVKEGIKLGEEKARKEFAIWLDKYYRDEVSWDCDCDGCQEIRNKLKELSQSIDKGGELQ